MANPIVRSVLNATRSLRWAVLAMCVATQAVAQPSSEASSTNSAKAVADDVTKPAVPTAEACVSAHRDSQTLRRQYHLLESRDLLMECSNTACPAPVRKDCQKWLDEVAVQISSVVVRVDTGDSAPPQNIKVYIDGALRFESIPNRAIELDPGTYRFRFEVEGRQPIELQVTVVEAEKLKNVTVKYSPPEKEAGNVSTGGNDAKSKPISISLVPPAQHRSRPVPTLTYVFAGISGAAALSFTYWGIRTQSLKSEMQAKCAPFCDEEYVDRVKTRALVADISLGVSVVALAGAALTYFIRPEVTVPVDVALAPLPNGGVMSRLEFEAF